jgi:hypothetical protein
MLDSRYWILDAFDFGPDGVLYAWDNNKLYSIDTANLTATHLRTFGQTGCAFAVVPEPATLLLLGLGVPIISGLRKRR